MSSEEIEWYVEYRFDMEMDKLDKPIADDIARQVYSAIRSNSLPQRDSVSQLLGGVCLIGEPTYFMVEYMNEKNYCIILLNLTITGVDTYLDLMNLSKTLKNDSKNTNRRRRNTVKINNKK